MGVRIKVNTAGHGEGHPMTYDPGPVTLAYTRTNFWIEWQSSRQPPSRCSAV